MEALDQVRCYGIFKTLWKHVGVPHFISQSSDLHLEDDLRSTCYHPNYVILKEHDVVIKDKKEIANFFNDYFVNTARDLTEITGYYAEDFAIHPSIIIIHKNNTKQPDKDCFRFQLTNKIQERE